MNTTRPSNGREAAELIEEADFWLDADSGWKGKLSGAERLARRSGDMEKAQVRATLYVGDMLGLVAERLGLLTESVNAASGTLEEIRDRTDDRLGEVAGTLDTGLDKISETLPEGTEVGRLLDGIVESLDRIDAKLGNLS